MNWQKFFIKFIQSGVLLFRLFVEPFGLFKVNKKKLVDEPAGPAPSPAQITIDAEIITSEIDPYIYGSFIEVLGKCIYGGIWDPENKSVPLVHDGLRKDVLDEVRALKTPIIRWPGGCYSDTYFWEDGIGPLNQRKEMSNTHWKIYGPKIGPKHDNTFGSDEFMLFLKEVNSAPYININFGSSTPEDAAAWVQYMNNDKDTKYGALRAKNGHPEPYNVKIWGIANEIFGGWEKGSLPADKYAHRYVEFAKAMRDVDPTIKLVAVGTDFDYSKWDRTLLEIAGDYIDYLSLHVYIPGKALVVMPNNIKAFYNIVAGAFEMERRLQWMADEIKDVMGDKRIPIAFDEWGPWWNIRQLYEGFYTLREGIFAATVFEILHRNANSVRIANFAQLVNVIPLIVTSPTDVYHNPIYLALQLFSNYSEKFVVSFKTECDIRANPRYGNIALTEIPLLGCSVTINESKNRLVIIGINRHTHHEIPTNISIANFNPEPIAKVFELNGPHHSAYNDFDKKNEVKITQIEIDSVGTEFTYNFPAHSVTALLLTSKK